MVKGMDFKWLTIEEWYEEHHTNGNFIWNIPPAAGDLAYEMVDKARLKHPLTMHILFIPRLFTGLWRHLLTRRSDCYIKIDWKDVWDLSTNFEALLMFICLPFDVSRNFKERRYGLLEKFQGVLQECRMLSWCGACYKPLGKVAFPVAQTLDDDGNELEDPGGNNQFMHGQNGDHLMVQFQCELFHFRNI